MAHVGVRVVRGPSWEWQDQDGGEGHLGTLTSIGDWGAQHGKAAIVQWDCGESRKYRLGLSGNHDLLLYDNATIGMRHVNITCDACHSQGIWGIRWKCMQCHDYDLCSKCYMSDEHNTMHTFFRIPTPASQWVKMPTRKTSKKIEVKGIFAGATVTRGPSWKWGSQDSGSPGKVVELCSWKAAMARSAARVKWRDGRTELYRVGFQGSMDLKCINSSVGGYYYKDHLPKLGDTEAKPRNAFRKGDKVITLAKQHQTLDLAFLLGVEVLQTGEVEDVTSAGDIIVDYGSGRKGTFKPEKLIKVYSIGDYVKIIEEVETARKLQEGHGGWSEGMVQTLGQIGQVMNVLPSGDLKIHVRGRTWTYNSKCACTVDSSELQRHLSAEDDDNDLDVLTGLLLNLLLPDELLGGGFASPQCQPWCSNMTKAAPKPQQQRQQTSGSISASRSEQDDPLQLLSEAAKGNVERLKILIQKFPSKVNIKHQGKTALHVASHQGHIDIVKMLLEAKADVEVQDDNGDRAMHFATYGNEHEVSKLLIKHGASVNSVNSARQTPLHVAAQKGYAEVVRVLCYNKCDVNIQDADGNTPLHLAVDHNYEEIIELLTAVKSLNCSLVNYIGYNPLHTAALKGSKVGVQRILIRARSLADDKKEDGFGPLHLAAYNGRTDVVKVLLKEGCCNKNARNNQGQTSLMLAACQGHAETAFLLVRENSNINVQDEDGNTALHLLLQKPELFSEAKHQLESDNMLLQILSDTGLLEDKTLYVGEALAYFLVKEGADLHSLNERNRSPLDYVRTDAILNTIRLFAKEYSDYTDEDLLSNSVKEGHPETISAQHSSEEMQREKPELTTVAATTKPRHSGQNKPPPPPVKPKTFLKSLGNKLEVKPEPLLVDPKVKQQETPILGKPATKSSTDPCACPDHWEPMDDNTQEYKLVQLDVSCAEYVAVTAHFMKTMQGRNVVIASIKRTQNPDLWESYIRKKLKMERKNNGHPVKALKLFHGTSEELIDPICQQNFDWRLSGLHGTVYGKGSYFARDAEYSDRYAAKEKQQLAKRYIFFARVLVGNYTKGGPSYVRPPSKDGSKTNLYDSCVNDMNNATIFVIFESCQVYPEYLIEYQENQ
ncbi:E3 ubiquitin-protein ligase MIB2-like [Protopterus annectens]|uniref:E3 ubiquitin-protein ligase MIB2-like n=1 Tax=Protopterus annectens TaxID=7888 RepID=UPI001CFB6863|nr:E3 ubiquitin-protein ligase MIB2-like [Protopterus annectens]